MLHPRNRTWRPAASDKSHRQAIPRRYGIRAHSEIETRFSSGFQDRASSVANLFFCDSINSNRSAQSAGQRPIHIQQPDRSGEGPAGHGQASRELGTSERDTRIGVIAAFGPRILDCDRARWSIRQSNQPAVSTTGQVNLHPRRCLASKPDQIAMRILVSTI